VLSLYCETEHRSDVFRACAAPGPQAYELIQGALVRWTELATSTRPPPTAVLIHGILGSRKNMQSFARRITQVCLVSLHVCRLCQVCILCGGTHGRLRRVSALVCV